MKFFCLKYFSGGDCIPALKLLLYILHTSHSFPDWLASTLREILACSLWPNQLGSLVPTSSPLPMATDLTTEPPSGSSSSSDGSQRTAATVKFTPTINTYTDFGSSASGDDSTLGTATRTTGPFSTFTDPKDMFPTGLASVHSVCLWTLLLLTTLAIMGGLWLLHFWHITINHSLNSLSYNTRCTGMLLTPPTAYSSV